MALTKEQIKEFEKTEKKAGDSQDFKNLAYNPTKHAHSSFQSLIIIMSIPVLENLQRLVTAKCRDCHMVHIIIQKKRTMG